MQIARTILWVLLFVGLIVFSVANWHQDVEVTVWDELIWDTKLPAVVVVSFLFGLIPMWLFHRGASWRLNRKLKGLQASAFGGGIQAPVAPSGSDTTPAPGSEPAPEPTSTPTLTSDQREAAQDAGPLKSDKP